MTTTTTDALDLAIQRQALDIELELYFRHQAPEPAERCPREPLKVAEASASPAPASNPNAAAFHQVHVYPKGRW